jgi:pimeloyl-ACP methyl ester carboxylesterase
VASRSASGEREAAIAAFVDYWNGPGAWARSSAALRGFLVGGLDRVFANFAAIAASPADAKALATLACPLLAVSGEASRAPAIRVTELLAASVPGARLVRLPGAGHMAPLTDPHLVDPLIARHVAAAADTAALPVAA